jgi:hypothetical protein
MAQQVTIPFIRIIPANTYSVLTDTFDISGYKSATIQTYCDVVSYVSFERANSTNNFWFSLAPFITNTGAIGVWERVSSDEVCATYGRVLLALNAQQPTDTIIKCYLTLRG